MMNVSTVPYVKVEDVGRHDAGIRRLSSAADAVFISAVRPGQCWCRWRRCIFRVGVSGFGRPAVSVCVEGLEADQVSVQAVCEGDCVEGWVAVENGEAPADLAAGDSRDLEGELEQKS